MVSFYSSLTMKQYYDQVSGNGYLLPNTFQKRIHQAAYCLRLKGGKLILLDSRDDENYLIILSPTWTSTQSASTK